MINISKLCKLIDAAIEDESKAGSEYSEILEALPDDEDFEKCGDAISEIMEDEYKHSVMLKRISKRVGCKKSYEEDDDEERGE